MLALRRLAILVVLGLLASVARPQATEAEQDVAALAQMDERFQEAVRSNDAAALEEILSDGFSLTTGSGRRFNKADLIAEAKSGRFVYERNKTERRKVTLRGDVAAVTGLLGMKGADKGEPFELQLWFTDVYVRTPAGWRNWSDQASRPLDTPKNEH